MGWYGGSAAWSSGTVLPSPLGYCSVTTTGRLIIFASSIRCRLFLTTFSRSFITTASRSWISTISRTASSLSSTNFLSNPSLSLDSFFIPHSALRLRPRLRLHRGSAGCTPHSKPAPGRSTLHPSRPVEADFDRAVLHDHRHAPLSPGMDEHLFEPGRIGLHVEIIGSVSVGFPSLLRVGSALFPVDQHSLRHRVLLSFLP